MLELSAVQFPHPGTEHNATPYLGGVFPWNVGNHRRKFLETTGSWVGADGTGTGELRFWGEWEPPSDVVGKLDADGEGLPRFLHRARWDAAEGKRQNTDPLVLGGFCYSNCRQHRLKGKDSPTRMQRLDVGSVVLFGSRRYGGWVLDTVFVVGSREVYGREDVERLAAQDPVLGYAAVQPLYSTVERQLDFVLYRGATVQAPVDGRYSFVPAAPAPEVFARPHISHPTMNANLAMATRLLSNDRNQVHDVWSSVRDQVLGAGLVLGTSLDAPAPAEAVDRTAAAAARAASVGNGARIGDPARAC